jgi:hypothetical protein
MEKKVFRSRMSVLLMVFILAICSISPISMIRSGNIVNTELYITIGVIAFIVFISCGIRYEITDKKLGIKLWILPFGRKHPISEITSVERSYNPISAPAASLKRLSIDGYGVYALISPAREQEFLETLKIINPNIKINVSDKNDWWRIWDWDI